MSYTHPDALQKVCEEIERTVWMSDRRFFSDYPRRKFRIRQATRAEIAEDELTSGRVSPFLPETTLVLVKNVAPGLRTRSLFSPTYTGDDGVVRYLPLPRPGFEPPEAVCRAWYRQIAFPQARIER